MLGQSPNDSTVQATLSLLDDPDPRVVAACRAWLLEWGTLVRSAVQSTAEHADPRVRVRARSVLMSLDRAAWRDRMRSLGGRVALTSAFDGVLEAPPLARAALFASRLGGARAVHDASCLATLVEWSDRLQPYLRRCKTASASARAIGDLLGGELGLHGLSLSTGGGIGHEVDAFDAAITGRRGSAIALSLIYLVVGRGAGLSMSGIELPDHFLVRIHGARPAIVDPFHSGRTITKADCYRYLRSRGHGARSSVHLEDREDGQVLATYLFRLALGVGPSGSSEVIVALRELARELA